MAADVMKLEKEKNWKDFLAILHAWPKKCQMFDV